MTPGLRPPELIVQDVARLRKLVEELMEISRLDAGREAIQAEAVDVPGIGRQLVLPGEHINDADLPAQVAFLNAELNHPFAPTPLGTDLYSNFLDEFATPIVGNFAAAQAPIIVVLNAGTTLSVQAVVSPDRQFLHFAFDDNRHRAVYVGAKLPPLP